MNISSKLTFYDTLCMLVCGYLICCLTIGTFAPNDNITLFLFSYIIGLVYHKIVEGATPFLRNIHCLIRHSWDIVSKGVNGKLPAPSRENYYKAYYCLMINNCLNSIPVLEAHVAFCKDLFFVMILLLVRILSGCFDFQSLIICPALFCAIACFIIIALIPVYYFTQMRIHKLVWEGFYFISNNCCCNCP